MKKFVVLAACLPVLAGCNTEIQSFFLGLPEGVVQEDLPIFEDAVASIGCKLVDESDYMPVEFQTGFPREKLQAIASYKVGKGQAFMLDTGGVQIVTDPACPAPAAPAATDIQPA